MLASPRAVVPRTSAIMPSSALRSGVAGKVASMLMMLVISPTMTAALGAASLTRTLVAGVSSGEFATFSTFAWASRNSSRTALKSVHFLTLSGLVQLVDSRSMSVRMVSISTHVAARPALNAGLPVIIQPRNAAREALTPLTIPSEALEVGTRRSTIRTVRSAMPPTIHSEIPIATARIALMVAKPAFSRPLILRLARLEIIFILRCPSNELRAGSTGPAVSGFYEALACPPVLCRWLRCRRRLTLGFVDTWAVIPG